MSAPEPDLRLGLGGAGLGNHQVALDDETAYAVLAEAWRHGVRLFDTAPHYGLGLSEHRLGDFLAGRPRGDFEVSTKVGRRLVAIDRVGHELDDEGFVVPAHARRVWDFSETGIRQTLEESLERLGLDHVDAVYLHDPERWNLALALEEGLPALHRLKEEGLARRVGVGSMDLAALTTVARTGLVDELMVAGRYTLIDQRAEEQLLPACAVAGIEVVAAAVFNGGLLAGSPHEESTFDYGVVPSDVLARTRQLEATCARAGVPLPAAALQFPLQHPVVTRVVFGAVDADQVGENMRLFHLEIPDRLWRQLRVNDEVDAR